MACHAAALLQHPPPPPPPPPASLPSTACTSSSRRRASPWGGAGRLIRLRLRGHCPSPASARAARVVSPRCSSYGAAADAGESPAEALRRVLESPGAHQAPACYDALSARLVGRAGFKVCFTSGTCSLFCLWAWGFPLALIVFLVLGPWGWCAGGMVVGLCIVRFVILS